MPYDGLLIGQLFPNTINNMGDRAVFEITGAVPLCNLSDSTCTFLAEKEIHLLK
jgi:hypothetical protein